MSRPMPSLRFASLAALCAVAACAPTPGANGGSSDEVGTVSLGLTLGGGFKITSIHYDISGNGFHKANDVSVASSAAVNVVVGGIPVGTGYTAKLSFTDADHKLMPCSGSAPFSITSAATIAVPVHLACQTATPLPVPTVPVPRVAILALGVLLLALGCRRARSLAMLTLASVAFASAGCSPGGAGSDVGAVSMALQVAGATNLDTINYEIDGPGAFTKVGQIDVSQSSTISANIAPLPPGSGFQITLAAMSRGGDARCAGVQTFDVTARQTTSVLVHLLCQIIPKNGTAAVNGALNACPLIDSVGASPAEVFVGGTIGVSSSAHDLDHAPSPLSYAWTTSGGTLSDPSAQNPQLTCTSSGPVALTLTVSDGDTSPGCADTQSITVQCTTGTAAGGSTGSGGASGGSGGASGGSGGASGRGGSGGASGGSGGATGGSSGA
ncbi:MAG TPA: PKD domain-containing protein, partial [Polyangia bacterium]|nr:PKD domain-containing protein [Polyangia bacterium]